MTLQEELSKYLNVIETFDKDSTQDGQALYAYMIQLTNYMARANFIMAEYGKKNRESKKAAYQKLLANSIANEKYFSASQGKDYVDSCCSETAYVYDLAERLSRSCVHTIDALRTIISSLKSERSFTNY